MKLLMNSTSPRLQWEGFLHEDKSCEILSPEFGEDSLNTVWDEIFRNGGFLEDPHPEMQSWAIMYVEKIRNLSAMWMGVDPKTLA